MVIAVCFIAVTVAIAQPGDGGPPRPPGEVPLSGSWLLLLVGAGLGALRHKFFKKG